MKYICKLCGHEVKNQVIDLSLHLMNIHGIILIPHKALKYYGAPQDDE